MVQQTIRDYLTASGFPTAAVSGAQITLVNNSANPWTDPWGRRRPLDKVHGHRDHSFRRCIQQPALGSQFDYGHQPGVGAGHMAVEQRHRGIGQPATSLLIAMAPMKHRTQCNRRRRGAVLVEAALVLPVVFVFFFAIIEYGRFFMTVHVFSNAVRDGAAYARPSMAIRSP